ncbi:PD-(D/E)XK nuclease domain-containing protein [uncultured Sutterella sp.]|uniref:PD-(D/E)XK nuclease domain-containing protein n=1 Tax=uncultured Sutterella sp. TaxID=286133 RepID=UPI0025D7E0F4|nr:PD-(D/E)XK nuclease domain-containing protein [uncultured Sutterella sp.]
MLNFLQSPEKGFFNWWYESAGQPAVLKNFSEIRGLDSPSVFFNERKVGVGKFYAGQEYEDLDETLLLFQGGYLSIEKFGDNEVSFRYPNEEVSDSLARYCAEKLLGGRSADDVGIENLIRALDADDPSRVIADFNRILTGIPCDSAFIGSENWCRNALALVLQGARVRTAAERHNAFGRSDLEIFRSHVHWFFEFKFARSNDLLERRLNEAEAQLRSRRYGEDDLSDRRMIRVAAVFSGTNRRISAWRRVDDAKLSDA